VGIVQQEIVHTYWKEVLHLGRRCTHIQSLS